MTKVVGNDPPVAGRSSLVKSTVNSKMSRRGRWMRRILLIVWRVVASIVAIARVVRWLFENL